MGNYFRELGTAFKNLVVEVYKFIKYLLREVEK